MLHSARGGLAARLTGQWDQSPAVAAGTLARPASCVYVRNSDAAGACPLRTLPKVQRAQMGQKSARVCKSAPSGVGKRPSGKGGGAKENYLCTAWFRNGRSLLAQRNRPQRYFSCPQGRGLVCIRGQLSLEAGLCRLLAFAFTANCYVGSHLAFPLRERGSLETLLESLAAEGQAAKLPTINTLTPSFFSWLFVQPVRFIIPSEYPREEQ